MICLFVWPCSNPEHRECFGVVDFLPVFLDFLQKREVRRLVYLEDHLSYDDAWALLRRDLLSEVLDALVTRQNKYDISMCNDPSHRACYNVVDVDALVCDDPSVSVVGHVSYIEALSKLYELWQSL
jgi:hypothetical protein